MDSHHNNSLSRRSQEKIRNIYDAIRRELDIEIIENLLKTVGDINYEILTESGTIPNLLFTSYCMKPAVVNLLLNHGADFTKKTSAGRTIVHELIRHYLKDGNLLRVQGIFKNQLLDTILPAHVKFNNKSNLCDENGISHFHASCITNSAEVLTFFLKNGVDVHHAVNADSPIFPLDTPLHLAAKFAATQSVEILLKYGANTGLKNANGLTPIHILVEICQFRLEELSAYEKTLNVLFEFELQVTDNAESTDDFGFCHLHVACLLQKESVVESILDKTKNVDQAVNLHSPVCAGYTALHFAASAKIDIFQLLLDNEANIAAENAKVETALDIFLQKHGPSEMHSVLMSKEEWRNIVLSDNKTKLIDVVWAMNDIYDFIEFSDRTRLLMTTHIPFDSPLLPGYTLLHLAAAFAERTLYNQHMDPRRIYDNSITDECLKRGAVVTTADAKGSTALHLAFYLSKRHLVKFLLDHHNDSKNPINKDTLSHFHIACAVRHVGAVEHFLSNGVDVNSPVLSTFRSHVRYSSIVGYPYRYFTICPGSTALHINVASGDHVITARLLNYKANVRAKDANGFTPIHRLLTSTAVRFHKGFADCAGLLSAETLENSVAEGGLSHLHVASYFGHTEAIEKLLDSGADVNAAITYQGRWKKRYYEDLFDPYGDADEPLNFLCDYAGYTPLHFAMLDDELANETNLLLISRGADIFKKAGDGTSFLSYWSNHKHRDLNVTFVLNNSLIVQKHFEEEFGWTKLHFACCAANLELVRKCIDLGTNVNARICSNSPVWKGYTPLHIVTLLTSLNCDEENVDKMKKIAQLLIENGADLTLIDDHRDTPFHLCSLPNAIPFLNFLFENLKNYTVNPTNLQGNSIFHLACATHNVVAIEQFLRHDVDVNQHASYFSYVCPGGTPLHLTIKHYKPSKHSSSETRFNDETISQIVDKLVQHGADVNATDAFGDTPLFGVVSSTKLRSILIPKLISAGTDLHPINLKSITPFELLLQLDVTWKDIEFFLKAGCHFNTFNPASQRGYIAEIFRARQWNEGEWLDNEILFKVIHNPQMIEISKEGRTAIHNIVSVENITRKQYVEVIEQLMNRGCEIDHQDYEGKTAMHLAVNFKNTTGVVGLLKNSADINLTDKSGKTFIAHIYETLEEPHDVRFNARNIMEVFAIHVYKLEFCGLHVNKQNKHLQIETLEKYPLKGNEFTLFHEEMEKTKSIKIGDTSLSLYEFLIDRRMHVVYMNLIDEEKQKFDQFFNNIGKHKFVQIDCLLKLVYRQTIERIKLIEPAMESLNVLTKNRIPDLCCRYILKFLINEDLKRLIALGT